MSFREDLEDLETAEDFLNYFEVPFDQRTVSVNRLHILQRFSDYLSKHPEADSLEEDAARTLHRDLLLNAYQDFVKSDAIQEKVFKVHKDQADKFNKSFVPMGDISAPLSADS